MALEDLKATIYAVPYSEFKEWAMKQSWICIHQSEHDFGVKDSAHHTSDTTRIGQIYHYITPMGMKVTILVEGDKVRSDG